MNKTCAGPPTRNQVSSASDWFASSRPRSAGICAFRSETMSGKLMRRFRPHQATPPAHLRPTSRAAGPTVRTCRARRADRCRPCRVRRYGRPASFRTAPARSPDEIAARAATACARTPAPGNAASRRGARSLPAIRNCRRANAAPAIAPSGASTEVCPASVSVNGAQPISLAGPGATRAPSAAAIICAPRQMPSIGLFGAIAAPQRRRFRGDERIGFGLIDADRAAQHDHQIGRDAAYRRRSGRCRRRDSGSS